MFAAETCLTVLLTIAGAPPSDAEAEADLEKMMEDSRGRIRSKAKAKPAPPSAEPPPAAAPLDEKMAETSRSTGSGGREPSSQFRFHDSTDLKDPVHAPASFTLLPGIGTSPILYGNDVTEHLAFNLLMGGSRRVFGLELGTGLNWTIERVTGFQIGAAGNVIEGELRGAQISGGANIVGNAARGIQATGGFNHAVTRLYGLQVSGGANLVGEHTVGAQVAPVNISDRLDGVQIGVVNIAGKVKGLQLGLINIAEDVRGLSFGLLNFIEEGENHLDVWVADRLQGNLGVKFGGRYFYTTVAAGVDRIQDPTWWSYGLGFGFHIPFASDFFVNLEARVSAVQQQIVFEPGRDGLLGQANAILGFELFDHFGVFAGASLNVLGTFEDPATVGQIAPSWAYVPHEHVNIWPGFVAGIQI